MMASTDYLQDTAVGDTVTIEVRPDGPYGFRLAPDVGGNAAIVAGWERLPNGQKGEIEQHGGIHIGDILCAVNDIILDAIPHEKALLIIMDRNLLKKKFKFLSAQEYYHRMKLSAMSSLSASNRFLSIVKRFRIVDTSSTNSSGITSDSSESSSTSSQLVTSSSSSSKKKYAEFEIVCQWKTSGSGLAKDMIYKWSVWRRFSQFAELYDSLKTTLGWHLGAMTFPSKRPFVIFKYAPDFLDSRRLDLDQFWRKLQTLDKVFEFDKHHSSPEVKAFLEVDYNLNSLAGQPVNRQTLVEADLDLIPISASLCVAGGQGDGRPSIFGGTSVDTSERGSGMSRSPHPSVRSLQPKGTQLRRAAVNQQFTSTVTMSSDDNASRPSFVNKLHS